MPHDAWRPSSPSSVAPHQYNKYGSDNSIGLMGGTVTPAVDNVRYKPILYYSVIFSWPVYLPLIIIGCFSTSDVSCEWSDGWANVISYGTDILLLMFVNFPRYVNCFMPVVMTPFTL
jgi:hypothetical protein